MHNDGVKDGVAQHGSYTPVIITTQLHNSQYGAYINYVKDTSTEFSTYIA